MWWRSVAAAEEPTDQAYPSLAPPRPATPLRPAADRPRPRPRPGPRPHGDSQSFAERARRVCLISAGRLCCSALSSARSSRGDEVHDSDSDDNGCLLQLPKAARPKLSDYRLLWSSIPLSCLQHLTLIASIPLSCLQHLTLIASIPLSCLQHLTLIPSIPLSCLQHLTLMAQHHTPRSSSITFSWFQHHILMAPASHSHGSGITFSWLQHYALMARAAPI